MNSSRSATVIQKGVREKHCKRCGRLTSHILLKLKEIGSESVINVFECKKCGTQFTEQSGDN